MLPKTCLLLIVLCIAWPGPQTHAQPFPGKIIPNVPDESQPPPSGQGGWCAPMAAVNIIDYWATVNCVPGAWGLMDGLPRGNVSEVIGWFMDTNNAGSPSRANVSVFLGTLTQDIQPGLDEYIQFNTLSSFPTPSYPPPPGKTAGFWTLDTDTLQSFPFYKTEIDSGRPAIICFTHWNIGVKDTLFDASINDTVYVYDWDYAPTPTPKDSTAPKEIWNFEEGKRNVGHAVTGVGYWEMFQPPGFPFVSDWAIVHDNWLGTPKYVAVPWNFWNATISADVGKYELNCPYDQSPYTIDGTIISSEVVGAASVRIPVSGSSTAFRCNGSRLYFAVIRSGATAVDKLYFCFDRNYDRGPAPQTDDIMVEVTAGSLATSYQGDGVSWQPQSIGGWNWAMSLSSGTWEVELEVDYATLNLVAGLTDTIGFSVWDSIPPDEWSWPPASARDVPCAWGELTSSQLWVPVELASFTVAAEDQDAMLGWTTATETNNLGFEIQRSVEANEFVTIGFVEGAGTSTEPHDYDFIDQQLKPNRYRYRLVQVDTDGTRYPSNEVTVIIKPIAFRLSQNFPNPFNNSTVLKLTLPTDSQITAEIFSPTGKRVCTLADRIFSAGSHTISWQGEDQQGRTVASGIYLCQVRSGNRIEVIRMLYLR